MIDEGYIKFECGWNRGLPPAAELIEDLNRCRQRLFDLGLIGHDRDAHVDYGNVSIRGPAPGEIIITGTQTGHLPTLSPEHYVRVTDYNIDGNRVECSGATRASSETLTHGAIYVLSPDIGAVLHVHHAAFWELLKGKIPTTAEHIAYGTPAMAREFARLYQETELPTQKIAAMGGHPAGLVSFGVNPAEAEQYLLDRFERL